MAERRLPSVASEGGLSHYLREIRKFPMLEAQEEYMLAKRWREHGDSDAAHALVTSHLRLVAKIAMGNRGYGLPVSELISEGNVGMMQAVKRFEPDRGFRLATYAMWWIRASIQEYILRSWSLVKIGTTSAQKKLFFNLRKIKSRLQAFEEGDLSPEVVAEIATRLQVPETDVIAINSASRPRTNLSMRRSAATAATNGRIGWSTVATIRKSNSPAPRNSISAIAN
jgi:RNA polymerase sigma-32 factor